MKLLVSLLVSLLVTQSANANSLHPLLAHTHGQHPAIAASRLESETPYFDTVFLPSIMQYNQSYTSVQEVAAMVRTQNYSLCTFNGWFESDGIIGVGSEYYDVDVGTIRRQPYVVDGKAEVFACNKNGKLLWSGTCGNAIKKQDGIATVHTPKVQAKKPECVPVVHVQKKRHVDSVGGIAVGRISIGSETTVVDSTFYTYDCK